jgi:hypothetical protein
MSQVIHLAAEVSSGQAHAVVADLDWPNATQLKPIEMPAELYWLPFDRKNRLSLLDSEKHPQLACLELPLKTDFSNVNEGPPARDSGCVLEPVSHTEVVYVPFWVLKAEQKESDWAAINARDGTLAAGELPASKKPAVLRLAVMLGLGIFTCFLGGGLIFFISQQLLISALKMSLTATGITLLFVIGYVTWRMRSLLPPFFVEPVLRVQTGRIKLPLSRFWLGLIRTCGLVVFLLLMQDIYRLIIILGHVFFEVTGPVKFSYTDFILNLLRIATAYLFVRYALSAAGGKWLPTKQPLEKKQDEQASGHIFDLVRICLQISILAIAGTMLGYITKITGLGEWLGWDRTTLPMFMARGAQVGAFLALHLTRMPVGTRSPLSVGMVAEAIARHSLDPWVGGVLVLTAVFLTALPGAFGRYKGRYIDALWNACRLAWGFALGVVVGKVFGRLLGLIAFPLFGWAGLVVGELLGALLGATAGYMAQRSESAQVAKAAAAVKQKAVSASSLLIWLGVLSGLAAAIIAGAFWAQIAIDSGNEFDYLALAAGLMCGGAVWFLSGKRVNRLSQVFAVLSTLVAFVIAKHAIFYHFMKSQVAIEYGQEVADKIVWHSFKPFIAMFSDINEMLGTNDLLWLGLAVVIALHLASPKKATASI